MRRNRNRPLPSGDKSGSLGEIAEQQTKAKGKQPRGPQSPGWHLADPRQPPLHGLGKEDIGNRFQNKDQTEHGDKKFHGRTLPAARLFFKTRLISELQDYHGNSFTVLSAKKATQP
jgi:hypothetical protein